MADYGYAQTEVTAGVMRGKDYGVTYCLPKTEIELTIQVSKHSYQPGEFCKYADRYLRLDKVSASPYEYWTLDKVQTKVVGVPDNSKVYFVKLKDKSSAPLMELTEEGVVRSINHPYSGGKKAQQQTQEEATPKKQLPDPKSFLTEEILTANSTAKMAELVAQEIYDIRESRNALLRGEADNTPKDGAQLQIMLDNLQLQEEALTGMFAGREKKESKSYTIRITPREMKDEVAFRFSRKLGLVDKEDLAGEPAYLSITDLKSIHIPPVVESEKKEKSLEGVAYNVPGRGHVVLTYNNSTLYDGEQQFTQFGIVEYLAAVLFNKNATTKVRFHVSTGALEKVETE